MNDQSSTTLAGAHPIDDRSAHGVATATAAPPQHHAHGEDHLVPTDLPKPSNAKVAMVAGVFLLILAVLFAIGYFPHRARHAEAIADAKERADQLPIVDVTLPKPGKSSTELILPGDVKPNQETLIYPRANGYLKKLYVDINDRVNAGDLLAEIDTPEVDAQFAAARAQLLQFKTAVDKATSDLDLAQRTQDRFEEAAKDTKGSVTEQQLDERRSTTEQARTALASARANVVAAEAEVQRLSVLQSYEKVMAPFSGIITVRNYDLGALLSPTNTGEGRELFRLAQTDPLQVNVQVPQTYSTSIRVGQPVELMVRNFPSEKFTGKVYRISGALDPGTRTMLVQLRFPNPDGKLFAGMYGTVRLPISDHKLVMTIPTSALLFRSAGLEVAVIKDNKVEYRKIDVARDLGTEIEVTSGLTDTDQVVANPGERLAAGVAVQIASKIDKNVPAPTTLPAVAKE